MQEDQNTSRDTRTVQELPHDEATAKPQRCLVEDSELTEAPDRYGHFLFVKIPAVSQIVLAYNHEPFVSNVSIRSLSRRSMTSSW
jgi:hypothetical protein